MPIQPKEFMLYYAAFMLVACLLFLRRRPRKGMRLKFLITGRPKAASGRDYTDIAQKLKGQQPLERAEGLQSRSGSVERPLNVVFNYNGHSWDAYEVLGLPAGSSPESVETAYQESLKRVDDGSKPFMQAAYEAIQSQWKTYKAANDS